MRIEEIRRGLTARLRARRGEIEQAALVRIHSLSATAENSDPEYMDGLRRAVCAALDYGVEAIERSEDRPPPIPMALLTQARLAAQNGVDLESVLRRYLAGYTLLGDFVIEEADRGGLLNGGSLKRLLRDQAATFDRVIAAISEEYRREAVPPISTNQRRADLVRRLLDGELLDTSLLASEFAYEFEAFHLGAIAVGPAAVEAFQAVASTLDLRLMVLSRGEGSTWAWMGSRSGVDVEKLDSAFSSLPRLTLALGESGNGLGAWRLTHRQALATLPIALRSPGTAVRYGDVALLASMLQDDLLVASLTTLYLAPLELTRVGGETARETLRAYFGAQRNVSSTAAALEVSRTTVTSRLRAIEEALERPLSSASEEIVAALRLDELNRSQKPTL